jgi:hypothetical protein
MRDVKDSSGVKREGGWIIGAVAVAVALCYAAPEYGYSPVLFFALVFYAVAGILRFVMSVVRDSR